MNANNIRSRMNEIKYLVLSVIVAILIAAYFLRPNESHSLTPDPQSATVEWVYDGDSLKLATGASIRLWGVDAPEKGEKGADAARNQLIGLVKGKRITFTEVDRDRYGRIVARVWLEDREINRLMIEGGNAEEYCRYSKGFYGRCGI